MIFSAHLCKANCYYVFWLYRTFVRNLLWSIYLGNMLCYNIHTWLLDNFYAVEFVAVVVSSSQLDHLGSSEGRIFVQSNFEKRECGKTNWDFDIELLFLVIRSLRQDPLYVCDERVAVSPHWIWRHQRHRMGSTYFGCED